MGPERGPLRSGPRRGLHAPTGCKAGHPSREPRAGFAEFARGSTVANWPTPQRTLRSRSDPGVRTSISLNLRSLLALALFAGGCSEQPAPREPAPEAPMPKELTASILTALGRESERLRRAPGRTGILAEEKKYSLFAEELIIRDFFQDLKGGVFVDVGCAWPIKASNTYYLEKHLGWTGIGIDALEDYAPAWKSDRPNSKFFAFIVTDQTAAQGTFYKSAGLGLSSVNRDAASGKNFGGPMPTEQIEVPTITLDDLLDREGITKIDLLSMDIEGHEATALAGFDIERFQPDLLVIEGHSQAVTEYLTRHGYQQILRYAAFDSVNRYFRRKPNIAAAPKAPSGS